MQEEVYNTLMRPMVDDFLGGKDGLLVAFGPSGSGKTHSLFGSAEDPGLLSRALRHIFGMDVGNKSLYLSIFEIREKDKTEKLYDLSPDGGQIVMHQSSLNGLKEVLVKDFAHADSILAHAKIKRATAMTHLNSQSSRSQCIINLYGGESWGGRCVLGFVDLAGAERVSVFSYL